MDKVLVNLFKKVKHLENEVIRLDKVKKDKDKSAEVKEDKKE